jgi:hypothetical protein
MKIILIIAVGLFFLSGVTLLSHAHMESADYQVKSSVLSGGATLMNSTNYSTSVTLGEPTSQSENYSSSYTVHAGFLQTVESTPSRCFWDIQPEAGDGDIDGLDLATYISRNLQNLEGISNEFGRNNCHSPD